MTGNKNGELKLYGIILAAGIGTRMKSKYSKVFYPFLGKSILENIYENLIKLSLDGIIIVISPNDFEKANKIFGDKVKIIIQEKPLGTADAVKTALNGLNNNNSNLLIMCGDTPLVKIETLSNLINKFKNNNADSVILSALLDNPKQYGRIIRDNNGEFDDIVEYKDLSDEFRKIKEINSGIYIFNKEKMVSALHKIDNNNVSKEYYFTDIFKIIKADRGSVLLECIEGEDEILGINSKKDLSKALKIGYMYKNIELIDEQGVIIIDPENTYIDRDVQIGRDSIIKPFCMIEGNVKIGEETSIGPFVSIRGKKDIVIIGNHCEIGPFTSIREGTIIEDEAHLGSYVEFKKVKFGRKSKSMHLSYIGDSEIGNEVNIGAGTITCNYDGFKKNVTKIEDNAFIGSDTILIPPITIGKGSYTAAGSTITEDVPADSLGVGRAKQVNKENWAKNRRNREGRNG